MGNTGQLSRSPSGARDGDCHLVQLADAFVISLAFPSFVAFAGIGTAFIVFAVIGVVVFPIVWRMVPETKERSLESLEAEFRHGTRIRTAADTGGMA